MLFAGDIGVTSRRPRQSASGSPPASVILTGLVSGRAEESATLGFIASDLTRVLSQRWQTSPDGTAWRDIPGASDATETIDIVGGRLTDLYLLRVVVDIDGADVASNIARLTYAAPIADGTLTDRVFSQDTGIQSYDTSADFTGDDLTFSVNAFAGVSVDPGAGVIQFATDAMAVQYGTQVTVTATNSGGSDSTSFRFDITAAATAPAQMLAPTLAVDGTDQITATLAVASGDGGAAITEYDLRYRPAGGNWTVVQSITNPYALIGLSASTDYDVQTRAQNALGNSPWSPSVSVTTDTVTTFGVETLGEEPVITTDGSGNISVVISNGDYAGSRGGVTWRRLCSLWRKSTYQLGTNSDGTALTTRNWTIRLRYQTDFDNIVWSASADVSVTVT